MEAKRQSIAQEIIDYLTEVQVATTNEIGLHLIARQADPDGYVPSRPQLEIILAAMQRDEQIAKIKKIKTSYFPEGYEITETRMRSFLWKLKRRDGLEKHEVTSHAVSA